MASTGCVEENSVGVARREIRVERAPQTEVGHRDIIRTIRSTGCLPVGRCRPGCGGMNGTLKPRAARRAELPRLYDARQHTSKDFLSFCIYGLSLRLREGRRALSYQGLPGIRQVPGEGGSR